MSDRNSTTRDQPDCTITLRRSPRLLTRDHPPPEEYPQTPDPQSEITLKRYPEIPKTVEELKSRSNFSGKSQIGSKSSATVDGDVCPRRSARFSGNKSTTVDGLDDKRSLRKSNRKGLSKVGTDEGGINQRRPNLTTPEKSATHRYSRRTANECPNRITKEELQVVESAEVSDNPSMHSGGKLEKWTKDSSAPPNGMGSGFIGSASTVIFNEDEFVDGERGKVGANSCKRYGNKLENRTFCISEASSPFVRGKGKEGDLDRGMNENRVKRKRNQVEQGHETDKEWTNNQEAALQRAYFAVTPTPHFWKKVAKLVPGKSAKDCFNKLHSDHLTPPHPRTHLRSRKTNSPSLSLSTTTMLKPEEPITRRTSRRKQSRHLSQKTLRQLLQKQYNIDQNYESDLFSLLEPTMNPSISALQQGLTPSTPEGEQKDSGHLKKCRERSSSSLNKKHISRLGGMYGETLSSPPVLKKIKNKALHEKYIDQLHCRDAKRKAAKVVMDKEYRKGNDNTIQKRDVIKAAKDALVFDAKDVIRQLHHVKVSDIHNFSSFDDDYAERDDYEVEDEEQ